MQKYSSEELLYKIIGNIYKSEIPLIFKGALVTKLILSENEFFQLERKTVDIDANWISEPPSMEHLTESINSALGELKATLTAVIKRNYGEGRSAGIWLIDKSNGEKVVSMDIDIKPTLDSRIYYYGEISFRGVVVNSILSDKLSAMSTNVVLRRAKDMIDIYALSKCISVSTDEIFEACAQDGRQIGDFETFLERKKDIEHAYKKLSGIIGKPEFEEIYSHLRKFIEPLRKKENNKNWSASDERWE